MKYFLRLCAVFSIFSGCSLLNTTINNSPSITPSNICNEEQPFRFILAHSCSLFSALFVETCDTTNSKYGEFESHFNRYTLLPQLSDDEEKWIKLNAVEQPGDQYNLYLLGQGEVYSGYVDDYSLLPSGDGGFDGFLCCLKTPIMDFEMIPISCDCVPPAGVAIKYQDNRNRQRCFIDRSLNEFDSKLENPVRTLDIFNEFLEIIVIGKIYCKNIDDAIYVLRCNGEVRDFIYCLYGDSLDIVPFVLDKDKFIYDLQEISGAFLCEDRNAGYDLGLINTKVQLLPDIDANGCDEIVIYSTVSAIFEPMIDVDNNCINIKLRHLLYIGP